MSNIVENIIRCKMFIAEICARIAKDITVYVSIIITIITESSFYNNKKVHFMFPSKT